MKDIYFIGFVVAMLFVECAAIPKGGVVFSDDTLNGCGLVDISSNYQNHYLRAVTDLSLSLKTGGDSIHFHQFVHEHADTMLSEEMYSPLGATQTAAAANHFHLVRTFSQDLIQSSDSRNEFPHVSWGLFQLQKRKKCIPQNTITGFIGEVIPDGWELVSGADSAYIVIAEIQNGSSSSTKRNSHSHDVSHEHDWSLTPSPSNYLQTFRAESTGVNTAPVVHTHKQTTGSKFVGQTEEAFPELPEVRIRFIRSIANNRRLPKGAVIGFHGRRVPNLLNSLTNKWQPIEQETTDEIDEKFINVYSEATSIQIKDAKISHNHSFVHSHVITTTESEQIGEAARDGQNQYINTIGHTHKKEITTSLVTEGSTHIPLYLNLYLILKN